MLKRTIGNIFEQAEAIIFMKRNDKTIPDFNTDVYGLELIIK